MEHTKGEVSMEGKFITAFRVCLRLFPFPSPFPSLYCSRPSPARDHDCFPRFVYRQLDATDVRVLRAIGATPRHAARTPTTTTPRRRPGHGQGRGEARRLADSRYAPGRVDSLSAPGVAGPALAALAASHRERGRVAPTPRSDPRGAMAHGGALIDASRAVVVVECPPPPPPDRSARKCSMAHGPPVGQAGHGPCRFSGIAMTLPRRPAVQIGSRSTPHGWPHLHSVPRSTLLGPAPRRKV